MKKEKSKAKQMYIEKGGNKFRNSVLVISLLFLLPIPLFIFVAFPENGGYLNVGNWVMMGCIIFTYLIIFFMTALYTKTRYKEKKYNDFQIVAFTNINEGNAKETLTLFVNDKHIETDYNRFVQHKDVISGTGAGATESIGGLFFVIALSFETYFYTKAKRQEIAEGKHIVKVSQVVEGQVITAEYHRFKHKLKIFVNDKEIK